MMPHYNKYEDDGCTLMVKFTCQRCGGIHLDKLEDMDKDPESYGYLHNLTLPEGWMRLGIFSPLLCPECVRAYARFMQNEKEEADQ